MKWLRARIAHVAFALCLGIFLGLLLGRLSWGHCIEQRYCPVSGLCTYTVAKRTLFGEERQMVTTGTNILPVLLTDYREPRERRWVRVAIGAPDCPLRPGDVDIPLWLRRIAIIKWETLKSVGDPLTSVGDPRKLAILLQMFQHDQLRTQAILRQMLDPAKPAGASCFLGILRFDASCEERLAAWESFVQGCKVVEQGGAKKVVLEQKGREPIILCETFEGGRITVCFVQPKRDGSGKIVFTVSVP